MIARMAETMRGKMKTRWTLGARSTRAALGAGRPNAPQPDQMAVTGRMQFIASVLRPDRCAVGQDDMADRGTGSHSSSSAHMGVRREISYAVRFQARCRLNCVGTMPK